MRITPFFLGFLAALNIAIQAPVIAFAAPQGVQPVPYAPSQPVAAGQPAAPTTQAVSPTGAAAPTGNDVITLRGGGMLRGRIIEVIPNDHATIALATGQNAIVEWSRIERIEQQSASPNVVIQGASAAPPPMPSLGQAPMPVGASGSVWIHLNTDRALVLEGRSIGTSGSGGWSVVCSAPCDREVPLDSEYRISGSGIRRSKVFRIEGARGQRVIIDINPGSNGGFIGGIVLGSVGAAVIVIGLTVVLFGTLEQSCYAASAYSSGCSSSSAGASTETTGWVITLVGGAAVVVGILLVVGNARTKQTQQVLAPGASADKRNDAWLRLPMWHDATSSLAPKAQTGTLFSGSF